ncbi:MAG: carboxypeptidase-like regulatory domain-containing protein [Planctomycetota bacterium]
MGVAGVDIDLISLGSGGNPHEANDGTDANGFFTTTCDAGVYEVRFYAPPPPTTTLLTGIVSPVVVAGTKNMGTITLTSGVSVSGTANNAANLPVGNIKVDFYNAATGVKYHVKANLTNAFGSFSVAVPNNTQVRYEFLTNSVVGQVLVPREIFATASGNLNVGTLTFQTGFHVTGTVRTEAAAPISGADVDVTEVATGLTLFTPSDNTASTGVFDVVVPAGLYDLDVTRPASLVLVSVDVNSLAVSAPVNVGVLTMRNGVFLSGTVRDHRGAPVLAADVNVYEVSTGLSLALSSDNTNAAGFYSVVVPPVLIDVLFSPPGPHNVLQKDRHDNVSVSASMVLDGQFPRPGPTSAWTSGGAPSSRPPVFLPFSSGTAGSNGVPHIRGTRDARGNVTLFFTGGRPGAQAALLLGRGEHAVAGLDGVHVVRPDLRLALRLDQNGEARFQLQTADVTLTGLRAYAQLAVHDAEAAFGFALSHVLALELP